ncbi:glutamine-hydrolyzing GMP synthase [Salsipaludibacter albus]|uniref:glutamine-hydrolyzing GMP synthase n=1 Tax=Salsipaludibacter albus TaxID=2849650 RepID=UPI001EE3B71C|nr:glutamine-hydrolyzing GMP synthase [Salsipaludibacter albus]MBY5162526.1 glutamine-hydrolyzing GMP synthase [Salsipaludibacter albus]
MTPDDVPTVLVVDFGAQYAQLIARRVREANVHSEIVPASITADEVRRRGAAALILSGGPASVYAEGAPSMDPGLLDLGVPTLGICYGQQLMVQLLGGTVAHSDVAEYGHTELNRTATDADGLLADTAASQSVWMSHRDAVTEAPDGFVVTARTSAAPCAVIEDDQRRLYGVQYHPEVSHTAHGQQVLEAFLYRGAGLAPDWNPTNIIDELVGRIRTQVGDRPVLCGLSGGVDSSVAAALVHRAVGDQLTCVFVDHGLMRHDEGRQVEATFRDHFHVDLVHVRAEERFLAKLAGVTDPETKRKIIGEAFIREFETAARDIYADSPGTKFLVQGTLYPDVIESGGSDSASTIKSHHNVGGLPDDLDFDLVEPLRDLFKDEVRALGAELGLPDEMVQRQPFPGPGLGVRIVGEVTRERLDLVRAADRIALEEFAAAGLERELWQSYAALLAVRSVGVQGDGRTYGHPIVIRAVTSEDAMTADWARLPHEVLARISSRITNEVVGVNRVVYDITSKPPGTIEWE